MPGINIYTDNSNQSKALNSKLYNDAKQWFDNYIKNYPNNHPGIYINMLIMDNVIIDGYDNNYLYMTYLDNYIIIRNRGGIDILKIFSDGLVSIINLPITTSTLTPTLIPGGTTTSSTVTPSPTTTMSSTTISSTVTPTPTTTMSSTTTSSTVTPTPTTTMSNTTTSSTVTPYPKTTSTIVPNLTITTTKKP